MRERLGAVVATLGLLVLAGCSGGGAGTSPEPSDATSPRDPGPTGVEEPGETTTESVSPSSGDLMDAGRTSIRAPEGWSVEEAGIPPLVTGQGATSTEPFGSLELLEQDNFPESTPRELTRGGFAAFGRNDDPEVSFDVSLGGVPAYRAELLEKESETVRIEYGAVTDGVAATLVFRLRVPFSTAAERERVVASVLASFDWG